MNIIIKGNKVICQETKEFIIIKKLNKGLSLFYGKPVFISNENFKEFEGDILALCFGFNQQNQT